MFVIYPATLACGEKCCEKKKVGDKSYTLVEWSGVTVPSACIDSCVYSQDDDPTQKFCFAPGNLTFACRPQWCLLNLHEEFFTLGIHPHHLRIKNNASEPNATVEFNAFLSPCFYSPIRAVLGPGVTFTLTGSNCKLQK